MAQLSNLSRILDFYHAFLILEAKMKIRTASFLAAAMLLSSPVAQAGSVEKKPLNRQEITQLAVEEELDKEVLAETEAGLKSGSGLIILLIIGVAVLVAL